jgi:hypothetical protein
MVSHASCPCDYVAKFVLKCTKKIHSLNDRLFFNRKKTAIPGQKYTFATSKIKTII